MAKRSATARSAPSRMNVQVDNGHVKTEPGEARIQEPSVTEWDPTGDPTKEAAPPEDKRVPGAHDTTTPARTEAPKDDADKQERIRKLLSNETPAAEETETEEKPAETEKPAAEPTKPTSRRDILANLGAERAKRSLEQQLKTEREARAEAERRADDATKMLKDGDLLSFARARGLTSDQAIDLLMNPKAEAAKPEKPTPAADTQTNDRLTRLEQRERDLQRREALSVVEEETKELDIPVTRATSRVAVADENGRTRTMSGRDLIMETAQRLWESDGKPAGDRRKYIKEAAPLVEEQLIADDKDRFEAYAKRGTVAAKPEAKPATTKKPAVPSVGSRSGGSTAKVETPELPEDPDERRLAIKRRLGW